MKRLFPPNPLPVRSATRFPRLPTQPRVVNPASELMGWKGNRLHAASGGGESGAKQEVPKNKQTKAALQHVAEQTPVLTVSVFCLHPPSLYPLAVLFSGEF